MISGLPTVVHPSPAASCTTVNPLTAVADRSEMMWTSGGTRNFAPQDGRRGPASGDNFSDTNDVGNNSAGGCTMRRVTITFATVTLGVAFVLGLGAETGTAQTLKAVKERGSI